MKNRRIVLASRPGEVVESRLERFRPGDTVVGSGGWQEYSVVDANQPGVLRKVDASVIPLAAYVRDTLGFDDCIDYKAERDFASLAAALDEAAPGGVDGDFENVGGLVLDVVISRMNAFGRIALCGMVSGYDGQPIPMARPALLLTRAAR